MLGAGALAGAGLLGAPMLNLGRCRLFAQGRAPHGSSAHRPLEVSTRAVDLVLGSPVIDMLSLLTLEWSELWRWQDAPGSFRESDYRRLEAPAIDVYHPAVKTGAVDPYLAAVRWMDGWDRLLGRQPCFLSRIETEGDLVRAPRLGPIGVIVGFQDSNHFRTVDDVEWFYRRGQRISQLTYNGRNRLGSGCKVRADRGLTRFGGEVVAAMDRLGMGIDVSHCGERTSLDAIESSTRPVLITHSNCRALVPGQPRCKSDRVIQRMARRGGVMGITVVRAFVASGHVPTLDDLLDHFDHVAHIAGVEHLGLGSDLDADGIDPSTGRPRVLYAIRGLDPRGRVFQIADGLLARGYTSDDVRLILGGNFLRALGEIWRPVKPPADPPTRRDPFCPAPRPRVPAALAG